MIINVSIDKVDLKFYYIHIPISAYVFAFLNDVITERKEFLLNMTPLTTIFKLLSDDTRLRMLILLYQQDLCVCELSGILEAPQPRISKNLSKLRDLDLVLDERKEKFVFYSLKADHTILIQTLQNIMNTLDHYPQLVIDQTRLTDKEKYLNQCCITCE